MQINTIQHTQTVQNFKDRIMDSVQKRQLEENTFAGLLKDVFGQDKVEVFYDNQYLKRYKLEATYVFDDKNNFILKEDSFDSVRNRNLKEIKKNGGLDEFAHFYESVIHEFSHGLYEKENQEKIDFLIGGLTKHLKKPEDEEKLMETNFRLTQKTLFTYESPTQIVRAINDKSKSFAVDQKAFAKFLHLTLLNDLKDESIAYIEGFKAKQDILGKKARFFNWELTFDEAQIFLNEALYTARQAYFNKYVPVKNLSRYA